MNPNSTAESALLYSLDISTPYKCERMIADEFQLYLFGFKLMESVTI